ncbi:MAG TPA: 3'-5' exonuclease [Gemmatirosa sp.]
MSVRPADTLLIERARDLLRGGPASSAELVARVCQLPSIAGAVADRLAVELLGAHPEFARGADGRWSLVAEVRAPMPTFDEWRAARGATATGGEHRAGVQQAGTRRTRASRSAPASDDAPVPPAPGDDDRLDALPYVVVDVETTGGSPDHGHRITEFAAVVVEGGEVREVYETLVNPERSIPPEIMRLTGISWEMVRDKAPFGGVCDDVVTALAGRVFVAHNAAFDWRFVSSEVARTSGRALDGRRLCTVRLARKLLPQLRSRSLGYVAEWYGATRFAETYFESRHGRERPWRHSAAGDAVATAHCLLRLLRDAADHGVTTWGALDAWLAGGTGTGRRRRRSALPTGVRRDPEA